MSYPTVHWTERNYTECRYASMSRNVKIGGSVAQNWANLISFGWNSCPLPCPCFRNNRNRGSSLYMLWCLPVKEDKAKPLFPFWRLFRDWHATTTTVTFYWPRKSKTKQKQSGCSLDVIWKTTNEKPRWKIILLPYCTYYWKALRGIPVKIPTYLPQHTCLLKIPNRIYNFLFLKLTK